MVHDYMASLTSGSGSNNTFSGYHLCSNQYHHHHRHYRHVKKYNGNNPEINDYCLTTTIQLPLPLLLQPSSLPQSSVQYLIIDVLNYDIFINNTGD